jgi:NADP-dependent 3-hydroxy acid dehydrogenase YdfG
VVRIDSKMGRRRVGARRADRLKTLSEELGGALAVPTDVTDSGCVAGVVLRLLRTGEESFDVPHGPERAGLAEIRA